MKREGRTFRSFADSASPEARLTLRRVPGRHAGRASMRSGRIRRNGNLHVLFPLPAVAFVAGDDGLPRPLHACS
ncbi:MAG: hypothetical protein M0C28_23410 [Candidatus Moduliflexus flocculans]|nr:hypothetical protein [Candidatus Moduliflexus flocculans]